jgi:hypothetical protein
MMDEGVSQLAPDERAVRRHLEGASFLAGVDAGQWRLVGIHWPQVIIAVSAAPRETSPSEYSLRFDFSGYPVDPPTAAPWDAEQDRPLDAAGWPKGHRVGKAFNPGWKPDALYIPCDRTAISDHAGWRQQYARYLWDPSKDLTFYLRLVHELLNDDDYQGI